MAKKYFPRTSKDVIDEIVNDPEHYSPQLFQGIINDAELHYKNNDASKEWYEFVVRRLSPYL